jgi:hypothetical protein
MYSTSAVIYMFITRTQNRKNWTGKTGNTEWGMQNRKYRTGHAEQGI